MNCVERISHYTHAVPPEDDVLPDAAAAAAAAGPLPAEWPHAGAVEFDQCVAPAAPAGMRAAPAVCAGRARERRARRGM